MAQHIHAYGEAINLTVREHESFDREYLTAIAAHELREPTQAILSFLNVVLQERAGPLTDIQRDFLSTAELATRRLKRRIDDLQLLLSGEHEFSLNPEPTDLVKQVSECCHELTEIANGYGVTVEMSVYAADTAWILADPVRLDQILLNLIENAIQYASAGSTVFVNVCPDTVGAWCVTVQNVVDEATDDDPNNWFIPFNRGDTDKVAARKGFGLGLTAVEYLVRAQGGQVMARSCGNQVYFGVAFACLCPVTSMAR